jgi:hydroxymethylpyrimidine kinase/phosphomethylpyrimidine kinase
MASQMRSRRRPIVVLSIAASDSGGGAGIQADLLTFAAHGIYGATVVTAVTAQNTRRVAAVEPVSARLVKEQLDAVFTDLRPAAVKIGALGNAGNARAVAAALERWRARNVVLDPVLAASTGGALLPRSALGTLRRDLLPLCDLVTPNIPEAEALARMPIHDDADLRLAAGIIADLGARAVLVKGGHATGRVVSDLLFDGRRFLDYRHPRLTTRATHGTGCTLSAAIAANLARGRGLEAAVGASIRYVEAGMRRGFFPGRGRGVPDHFPAGFRR